MTLFKKQKTHKSHVIIHTFMSLEKGVGEFTSGAEHEWGMNSCFLFILAYFHLLQVNIFCTT